MGTRRSCAASQQQSLEPISHLIEEETTMKNRNTRLGIFVGTMALMLGVASFAWACSAQPSMQLMPRTGPTRAGETVPVNGNGWSGFAGAVQIRWNSATGPVVGTAERNEQGFSGSVTIPADVAPGVYYLVAQPAPLPGFAQQPMVLNTGTARAAISIDAPSASSGSNLPTTANSSIRAASADLWTGLQADSKSLSTAQTAPATNPAGSAMTAGLALAAAGIGGSAAAGLIVARRKTKARRTSE